MTPSNRPAVWFPAIRAGTGSDTFTLRLCHALNASGIRAEITWLPLRAEYAPWSVPVPRPPLWANILHANSWLHPRFLPDDLPVVATIHHAIHDPNALAWKGIARAFYHQHWIAPIERRVLRRADCVAAVSRFAADSARSMLLDVPMRVVYNGVDTGQYRPARRPRARGEPFRLLYVGSWQARKGVDLLDPIMRTLGKGFELRYTGGPGVRRHSVSQLPPNMHDIGRLAHEDAVISAMQDADAFLFPSRSEGFGLVVAEAMACGLPVIAADTHVMAELVEHEVSGILCPVDDSESFAAAARLLASDAPTYRGMGKAARERAEGTFSMSGMLASYLESYAALLT